MSYRRQNVILPVLSAVGEMDELIKIECFESMCMHICVNIRDGWLNATNYTFSCVFISIILDI